MARIALAPGVLQDFERILEHLRRHQVDDGDERIDALVEALDVLEDSPLLGRPSRGGKRELVIGKRTRGYVALYRYVPGIDTIIVLAVRAQREARFKRRR